MPVPMQTLNHDGVKFSTTRLQPCRFCSRLECPVMAVFCTLQVATVSPHIVDASVRCCRWHVPVLERSIPAVSGLEALSKSR